MISLLKNGGEKNGEETAVVEKAQREKNWRGRDLAGKNCRAKDRRRKIGGESTGQQVFRVDRCGVLMLQRKLFE